MQVYIQGVACSLFFLLPKPLTIDTVEIKTCARRGPVLKAPTHVQGGIRRNKDKYSKILWEISCNHMIVMAYSKAYKRKYGCSSSIIVVAMLSVEALLGFRL